MNLLYHISVFVANRVQRKRHFDRLSGELLAHLHHASKSGPTHQTAEEMRYVGFAPNTTLLRRSCSCSLAGGIAAKRSSGRIM